MRLRLIQVVLALLVMQSAGCAFLEPQPAPAPAPVAEPEPAPPPPQPQPEAEPEPEPETGPFEPRVAVVLSSRAAAYRDVAIALAELLPKSEVYDLSDRSLSPRDAFLAIDAANVDAVVAIGLRAAVYARDYASAPVIYAQVFNVAENDLLQDNVRGVAAIPPLDKQLAAWRPLAPRMQSVGAIVGSGHEALLAEARAAADAEGLAFHYRTANSDREALYQFTRMVPQIDGFWLFPDNRILSAAVLRDMLDYAARHNVQVAVFNDRLLELGATVSATTDEKDIARTVVAILKQMHARGLAAVPGQSALGEIRIRINEKVQRRMQLATGRTSGASP